MTLSEKLQHLLSLTRSDDEYTAREAAFAFFRLARDKGIALHVAVPVEIDVQVLEPASGTRDDVEVGLIEALARGEGPEGPARRKTVEEAIAEFQRDPVGGRVTFEEAMRRRKV